MKEIKVNTVFKKTYEVTDKMRACIVGSGDVNVLATPIMISFMENCASECLKQFLDDEETSVGTMINTTHISPTPVGMKVFVDVIISDVDGKKVTFDIKAFDEKEEIGTATHQRFILNKEKFEQKCSMKLN